MIFSLSLLCLLIAGLSRAAGQDKVIDLPMKSTHNGELYYVELGIGQEEEAKTYNLLVASDYPVTWIQSAQYDEHRGYPKPAPKLDRGHQLRASGSFYGYNRMHIFNETILVGPQIVHKQAIGVLYNITTYFFGKATVDNTDGVLGLNDGKKDSSGAVYLFENLYKLKYIDQLKYSLYMNKSASGKDNDLAGALVLGGINEKYYTGELNYVKLYKDDLQSGYNNRSIVIDGLQLDWTRTQVSETLPWTRDNKKYDFELPPMRLKLDSSSVLFGGPKDILDKLHLNMLKTYSIFDSTIYAFKDCRLDNKPDLVFSLMGGFDVKITPEDYVIEYSLHGRNICISGLKPFAKVQPVWFFGTKFMRNYYTLFDYENNVVGFATPA